MRIRFLREGGQRAFLDLVIERLRATSLRGLLQFGFDVPYSTLKNYNAGARLMPEGLFDDLCGVAGIERSELSFDVVDENWGKVLGGRSRPFRC